MVAGAARAYGVSVMRDLFRPWREQATWWSLTHLMLDVFAGAITFSVVITLLAVTVALLITFPLALPFAWLLFVLAHLLARMERSRIAALLGERIDDPVPPLQATGWWSRLVERAKSGRRWKEIAYLVLALPMGVLTTVLALVAWCLSASLFLLPLYVNALPADRARLLTATG